MADNGRLMKAQASVGNARWWRGFYAVLDRDDQVLAQALLEAGAGALQLRLKHATAREILAIAAWARPLTRAHHAALVINDRLDLALAADADAVHLGQDDMPLARARELAAGRLQVGISTHNVAQVEAACQGGADYLGFGPVFATGTKANPDPVVGLTGLAAAVQAASRWRDVAVAAPTAPVPVVAIGGISLATIAAVAATGAAGACVISAVNGAASPQHAGAVIAACYQRLGQISEK